MQKMAGSGDGGKSIGNRLKEGLKEGVKSVTTWFANGQEFEARQVAGPDVDLCIYCQNPMLLTYNGCRACEDFKVTPGTCKLLGCNKLCYYDKHSRRVHDFCGRTHATEYQQKHSPHWNQQRHYNQGCNRNYDYGYNTRSHVASQSGPIYFYNRDEPYYEFTNFYDQAPIVLDDVQWRTTEHYFQAQKFVGTPYVEWIRRLGRPREAFDLSRDPQVSRWRRSDWEDVKVNVMYKALLAKFSQHEYLRKMLLATGERHLIEHTHRDSFWGDGGDGSGQNRLGKLLMKVREDLPGAKREGRWLKGTPVDTEERKDMHVQSRHMDSSVHKRVKTDSESGDSPSLSAAVKPHSEDRLDKDNFDEPIELSDEHMTVEDPPVGDLIDLEDNKTETRPNPALTETLVPVPFSSTNTQVATMPPPGLSPLPLVTQSFDSGASPRNLGGGPPGQSAGFGMVPGAGMQTGAPYPDFAGNPYVSTANASGVTTLSSNQPQVCSPSDQHQQQQHMSGVTSAENGMASGNRSLSGSNDAENDAESMQF